jgi:hypothetical protein
MTTQAYYAILTMCTIVIVCYALRNSEAHYLPDLFGLALALAAPRQAPAIAAWVLVVLIRHTPIGFGLAANLPGWLLVIALPRAAGYMSIPIADAGQAESDYKARISEPETNSEPDEIPQPVAENSAENINLGEIQALARLVLAEKIGLTEAVKIGAGAKSGAKYQRRSAELKAEIERQRSHFPQGSNLKRYD